MRPKSALWRRIITDVFNVPTVLVKNRAGAPYGDAILAGVATGVFGPYLHGLLFLQALERIDAAKAALMNRVQPAIVFVLSWLLLSRLPETDEIYSAAFLVVGCGWLAMSRSRV